MSGYSLSRRAGLVGAIASTFPIATEGQAAESSAPKRGYADGPYGQIHYRFVKPARAAHVPLVCLHPSPLSSLVYQRWLVEMGKDRPTFAPDTPGYGNSDAPPAPVEIGDFAEAMIAFANDLNLKIFDVMGYHTGSMTSVELARRYPKRVRKVVMISAPNYTDEERAASRSRVGGPAPTYEQALERALEDWRKNGKGLFRDEPDKLYFDISMERLRRYRTSNWGFRAAYNYDIAKALGEVNNPTLLLNPEDDVWKTTLRVKPYMRNGTMHDLPGWTHGHLDAHTVEMANIVRPFLDT